MTEKPSLTLAQSFKAPPSRVFQAWIDPTLLARWFCVEGGALLHAETTPVVGGAYRIRLRTPDGEEAEVSGVYQEVVPDQRLVFSWAWAGTPDRVSRVTVVLTPEGAGTHLTLTHEGFFDEAARDRHQHGWSILVPRIAALD